MSLRRSSGVLTGTSVVESVAYGAQSAQQVVTVAGKHRYAGVIAVKSLMHHEFCGRQPVIPLAVADAPTDGALVEHAGGEVDLDGDRIAGCAGPFEQIEEAQGA